MFTASVHQAYNPTFVVVRVRAFDRQGGVGLNVEAVAGIALVAIGVVGGICVNWRPLMQRGREIRRQRGER